MRIELISGAIRWNPLELLELARKLQDQYKVAIQIFDSSKILDPDQLIFAAQKALQAFQAKRNISKSLQTEILLRAAGRRQISEALKLGVTPHTEHVTILGVGQQVREALAQLEQQIFPAPPPSPDLEWLMDFYRITPQELEIVGKHRIRELILERIALLEMFR